MKTKNHNTLSYLRKHYIMCVRRALVIQLKNKRQACILISNYHDNNLNNDNSCFNASLHSIFF